jgi:DNA-binding transcriptional ArsR family regulator
MEKTPMPHRKRASSEKTRASKPQRRPQRRTKTTDGQVRQSRDLVDHQVMKGLLTPVRANILAILAERVASPKEIADETGETLAAICYHVRVLHQCDLIEIDHKTRVRGAIQRFYRALDRTIVPHDAWDKLPSAMRKSMSACLLREFFDDALDSLEAEVFDDPAGDLSWTPLVLDGPGVQKIGTLVSDFLEAVLDTQVEANKRLAEAREGMAGAKEISMTVFLASFMSARSVSDGKKAAATKRR